MTWISAAIFFGGWLCGVGFMTVFHLYRMGKIVVMLQETHAAIRSKRVKGEADTK